MEFNRAATFFFSCVIADRATQVKGMAGCKLNKPSLVAKLPKRWDVMEAGRGDGNRWQCSSFVFAAQTLSALVSNAAKSAKLD